MTNRIRTKIRGLALLKLLTLITLQVGVAGAAPPVVLFTDVPAGPDTGGENDNGIYISIFGRNLGTTRGSSTVFIGDVEVAAIRYWGPATSGVTGLQQITVQPGVAVSGGAIRVRVGGENSNTDQRFTVRPGRIWFVSQTGNDGTCAAGNIAKPCRSVNATYKKMSPGDFIVVRGGNWTKTDGTNGQWIDTDRADGVCSGPDCDAATDRPFAVLGYPGESVVFDGRSGCSLAINGYASGQDGVHRKGFWFSNINIRSCTDSVIQLGRSNSDTYDDHWRIVNVGITGSGCGASGTVGFNKANHLRVYGLRIDDANPSCRDKLHHQVYFTKRSVDVDFGWGELVNGGGGGAMNMRASDHNSSPVPPAGQSYHRDFKVHDTRFLDCPAEAIHPAQSAGGTYWIYNNLIVNSGRDPGRAYAGIRIKEQREGVDGGGAGQPDLHLEMHNNVIYGVNGHACHTWGNDDGPRTANITNNVCVVVGGNGRYYIDDGTGASTLSKNGTRASNNLWFGGGTVPAHLSDPTDIQADPQFVNVSGRDFHLKTTSPAIDAGALSGVARDLDGVPRPQGAAVDIGVFESPVGDCTTTDRDGDGHDSISCGGADCNDLDPAIHPGRAEACDLLDNDCDGIVDEGFDADGDGFSVCATPVADCNDALATIHPGAVDLCGNGIDEDCSGGDAGCPSEWVLEAEEFVLLGYSVEADGVYGNGQGIRIPTGGTRGEASLGFPGPAASYDVELFYVVEDDGTPQLSFTVAGRPVGSFTYELDSLKFRLTSRTFTGVAIGPGDELRLAGTAAGTAYARVDRLVVRPASGGGGTPPDAPTRLRVQRGP